MKPFRFRLVVGTMVITLLLIAGFQLYWLNQSYSREKQLLRKETSVMLRETNFALQFGDHQNTSGMTFRFEDDDPDDDALPVPDKASPLRIRSQLPDSQQLHNTRVMISITSNDTIENVMNLRSEHSQRSAADSLSGIKTFMLKPVDEKELTTAYTERLSKAGIPIPFKLHRFKINELKKNDSTSFSTSAVPAGFDDFVFYKAEFSNYTPFIWKRIWPQLLISLVLVLITAFTFLLLYRTLIRQKKMTEQKDQFISNITHELKTPIATVSVALEALQNFNAMDNPERTREYLDISQKELQRLSLLVDKVLKLSLFENDKLDIHKERLAFDTLVADVCSAMKLQFEKQGATCTFSCSGSNPTANGFNISGDRLHLTGVLFNLLDNALKYSTEKPEIAIVLFADAHEITATVSDNGIGISPENHKKIFEKFFRVQVDNRHDVKGYGLGLSYVAGILEKHGGKITVESSPGKGSAFKITLPRNDE